MSGEVGKRTERRGRSLIVAVALVSAGIVPAVAQDVPPQGVLPQVEASDPSMAQASAVQAFDIPAQPLGTALVRFSEATGIQLFFDATIARGLQSPGVSGSMTRQDALGRLLSGSGLVYRFTNATTVAVERPGASGISPGTVQLDPVQVQAFAVPQQALIDNLPPPYAGGQVATGGQLGILGNRDVMDTPFNQTSYTAQKAKDQQAQSVKDVLIDDPSVRGVWAGGAGTRDDLVVRGFRVNSGDYAFGGLYGVLPQITVPAELPERIELLKGPSAMLNGMPPNGSIGGAVNLVPKRAPDEDLTQVTANYTSIAQFGGHADMGRRFGPDKQFGVRFNGVYRAGETAIVRNTDELGVAALGLDFRGERVRLSADLGYQYQYVGGLVAMPTLALRVPVPSAPELSNNFGQPWGFNERKEIFGVVRAEVDVTERITAYAAFGGLDSRAKYMNGGFPSIINANGNTTQTPINENNYTSSWTGEIGARALVETGPVGHEFALSATTFEREVGFAWVNGTTFASNIYNPTFIARPNLANLPVPKTSSGTLSSLVLADTLSAVDKRLQLTVGGRLQQVKATNFNAVTGAAITSYDQSALSPSVALVFKPWKNVSVYGNFIQGLQQGAIVGAAYTNAGQIFPPYKSTQYEAGVKVDWGRFTTTASAFQITQPSAIVNTVNNTLNLNGEQRNQGIEINVFGEPTEGVRLLGGVMFIDAVLAKTAGGLTNGWEAPGVPDVQLNLSGEWDTPFARGLTLNSRLIYTSSQYVDTTLPRRSIPEWARIDIGARYTFDNVKSPTGHPIAIRFNVDNLFDTNYWAAVTGNYLVQGTPRTFRLSTTVNF